MRKYKSSPLALTDGNQIKTLVNRYDGRIKATLFIFWMNSLKGIKINASSIPASLKMECPETVGLLWKMV